MRDRTKVHQTSALDHAKAEGVAMTNSFAGQWFDVGTYGVVIRAEAAEDIQIGDKVRFDGHGRVRPVRNGAK